jgi:hypothetical protein
MSADGIPLEVEAGQMRWICVGNGLHCLRSPGEITADDPSDRQGNRTAQARGVPVSAAWKGKCPEKGTKKPPDSEPG